jgi:hypothetical protein
MVSPFSIYLVPELIITTMKRLFHELKGAIIILFCIFLGVAIVRGVSDTVRAVRFQKCIQDEPTDAVCDSCYYAVYGVHAYQE